MDDRNPYRPPAATDDAPLPGVRACPHCGNTTASKVTFNWWGGALGPRLFHVVRCHGCRKQYNGRTGGSLTRVIIVYQGIFLAVAAVLFALWVFAAR
jgi:transposase-like protein